MARGTAEGFKKMDGQIKWRKAVADDFPLIRQFYWNLIEEMREQKEAIGWQKGIYPSDDYLRQSILRQELYTFEIDGNITGCVILNSDYNEGYGGIVWSKDIPWNGVLIPHALGIDPKRQRRGYGKMFLQTIIAFAKKQNNQAIRLDILGKNTAAEKLYTALGFRFIAAKQMFYPDTGWTEYKMFELIL